MDAAEKSFFKKYTSRINKDKSKQYVKLFDAIAKQKEYDEAQLLHRFRNAPLTKHFTATKHYLYNTILDALEQFYRDKEIDVQLNSILSQVNILHYKLLYKQALKLNEKGLKLARKWGKKMMETRFLHLKMLIIRDEQSIKILEKQLDPLYEEIIGAKSGYQHLINLDYASAKRLIILRKSLGTSVGQESYEELKGLMANLSEEKCYNNRNLLKYIQIQMHLSEIEKDYDKVFYWAKKSVDDQFMDKQIFTNVIVQYQNMLSRCVRLMYYDEMPFYIDKIKHAHLIDGYSHKQQNVEFGENRVYSYSITYCFQTRKKDECIRLMNKYNQFLTTYSHPEHPIWGIVMKSIMGLYSWDYERFSEALDDVNHVLNVSNPKLLPQYQFMARATSIGINLEQGNHRLVEYKINEAERYLKKANLQHEICKKTISVLKKLYNAPDRSSIRENIRYFEEQTVKDRKDFDIFSGFRDVATVIINRWKK